MSLSKKEVSILIEIIFAVLFAVIFMPYFYENRLNSFDFVDNVLLQVFDKNLKFVQMVVFSIIYYSIAYAVLETTFKEKIIKDERDDMISSKAYKLGFILYELSLFVFIGVLLSNPSIQNSGSIIFFILFLLLSVLFIKSTFQLYLYRTS